MKFMKIASILLMFGFLFIANAISPVTTSNDNSTVIDLNDNSTNSNATVLDISKGRSVISGDIDISKLSEEIHSVWIVDAGNWKGYSPHQLVREEIQAGYGLLEENIPARKATIVFAMEDTQLEVAIPNEPQSMTRLYGKGLSLHGANGESISVYDILCSTPEYTLSAAIKVMGDEASLFVPESTIDGYGSFMNINESEGYYVLCEKAKEE